MWGVRAPRALQRPGLVPDAVCQVLAALGGAGHRSWVVGGVVRDLLLRRTRHDPDEFDLATPATPQQVQALFPRVIPTGIDHGTVTVLVGGKRVEVTTFRGEGEYLDGRRPSSVHFHGDLEEDLARRDFTMNAMAWDPLAGEFRDPFDGVRDLRNRVIRAVGDPAARFAEDGLRPLRAVRFAAQLGFRLDRATRDAIRPVVGVVAQVSRERVAEELSRLLVAPHAGEAIELLEATGLLEVVLPALAALPPDRVRHAVAVARDVVGRGGRGREPGDAEQVLRMRLAALLHALPAAVALRSVVELRLPNRVATGVATLVQAAGCLAGRDGPGIAAGPVGARRWMARQGLQPSLEAVRLWSSDARHLGRTSAAMQVEVASARRRVEEQARKRPPLAVGDLKIDGREVMRLAGLTGGPAVGEILRHLLERVVEDPGANRPDALADEVLAWMARGRQSAP